MQLTEQRFSDLPLLEELLRNTEACGFEYLTEVQARSLPLTLEGKDLAVQAQTGSGKTAAFLLTIYDRLLRTPRRKTEGVCPRAIILTPTRELAVQVSRDAEALGAGLGLRILVAYGGVDYQKQREDIRQGVDLLIGTPGRLIDYLKQRVYHLRDVEIAVIDEADRMFDMGFIADIRFLLKRMSRYDQRQSMLYSATLSDRVMELSYEYMNVPELVEVTPDRVVADKVEQVLYHLGSGEKFSFLLGYLETEQWSKALAFVNTKRQADRLRDFLEANGHPAEVLSGDVTQQKRIAVLKRFMRGEVRILVATDVASRGLHIEGVSHVFNYDLPQEAEDYVHRIGRTGRAGESGKAVSLACEDYVFSLPEIEAYIGHPIPVENPDPAIFREPKIPPRRQRSPSGRKFGERRGGSQRSGGARSGGGRGSAGRRRR